MESVKRSAGHRFVTEDGGALDYVRLIRTTEGHDYRALLDAAGDDAGVAQALVDGDPEIDFELVGRKVGPADRVWVRQDGSVLYAARVLKVTEDPHGEELSRVDFVDIEASVGSDDILPWTGRLFPKSEVVRRFALVRKVQLRHINGLTFDFLFDIARTLQEQQKMLLVGSGTKGSQPLIFTRNGSPYRGFLEGRVEGDGFLLMLHLSNLELKLPEPKPAVADVAAEGGEA